MEHTGLPWTKHVQRGTLESGNAFLHVGIRSNSVQVANCPSGNVEANAEYIVRACNAFPAMEAVLLNIQAHVDSGEHLRVDDPEYADLKAALAAGGE